jgi:hypothetical protein
MVEFVRQDDMQQFIRLVDGLKNDNAKLDTGSRNQVDTNKIYGQAVDAKNKVERAMTEMGTDSRTRLTKSRRKNLIKFRDLGSAVSAAFDDVRRPISKIVLDAAKYADGLFDEMKELNRSPPNPIAAEVKVDHGKKKQYNDLIPRFAQAQTDFNTEQRRTQELIRQARQVAENLERDKNKFNRKVKKFLIKNGFTEPVVRGVDREPLVTIFNVDPTSYKIDEGTSRAFELHVNGHIKTADDDAEYHDLCSDVGKPSLLTTAQQTPYYYSNPTNPVSILLNHSAGSGKTAAMTLVSSLYVRAGYLPIIVTTDALANEKTYEEATFLQCADFNIQDLMLANKCKTLVDVVEQTLFDPTQADVFVRGKQLYREMTSAGVWDDALKMTFKEFTAICRTYLSNETSKNRNVPHSPKTHNAWKILRDRAPKDESNSDFDKIFDKTVILMDEVHSMLNEPQPRASANGDDATLDYRAHGDIRVVTKALWRAREHSGQDGPVVVAASATPGKSGYEFVMILNLLCEENQGYHFDGSDRRIPDGVYKAQEVKAAFDAANPDFVPLATQMAYGHVSYYDSGGSKSVPAMRPLKCEVRLTREQSDVQTQEIRDLEKKHIHLVQGDDGDWFIESDFERRYNRTSTNDQTTLANFIKKVKQNSAVARSKVGKELAVQINRDKAVPKIDMRKNIDEWRHNAQMISPLYFETIEQIKKNKNLGVRKQYVYIAVQEDDVYPVGITLFCNMLDSLMRYNNVSDKKSKDTHPEGTYGKLSVPTRRGVPVPDEAKVAELRRVLSLFNSTANKNGAEIDVIVLDKSYSEGISLAGVGAVFVVGAVETDSELVQSVARAFRNCRTDPNELRPTADVPVYLMIPYSPKGDTLEILRAVSPPQETDKITRVCKECAFDRTVLDSENKKAEGATERLRQANKTP